MNKGWTRLSFKQKSLMNITQVELGSIVKARLKDGDLQMKVINKIKKDNKK